MLISVNHLKKFINLDESIKSIVGAITNVGHEVEGVKYMGFDSKIVVGDLVSIDEHPNASKLTVCKVDVGSNVLVIVCGAPNHRVGDRVAVAMVGAKLPNGFEIGEVTIRGVESSGMLCSEKELGISEEHEGILILPSGAPVGEDLGEYLFKGDVVLDLDITPNRGDCLSHLGIARELAAYYDVDIDIPESEYECEGSHKVEVEVSSKSGISYMCRSVGNVKVENSPLWLKIFLNSMGIKSINNVVDVSNYIMLIYGHPIHLFDLSKIEGRIEVREAHNSEEIDTLDETKLSLSDRDLVISDEKRALAVAGIIGGEYSAVSEDTTTLLVEVANFSQDEIRSSSKRLNVSTESSKRFERGIDLGDTQFILEQTLSLLSALANGVASNEESGYVNDLEQVEFTINLEECDKFLGTVIPRHESKRILERLSLTSGISGDTAYITVPSYRHDIHREEDIYEEIARIYGYNKIEPTMPSLSLKSTLLDEKAKNESITKSLLASLGLNEVINYSFLPEGVTFGGEEAMKILNPINDEMVVMRTSTLYSILKNVDHNLNNGKKLVNIFEVSRVFLDGGEKYRVGIAMSGKKKGYLVNDEREIDFFDIKGVIEEFLKLLGISPIFESHGVEELHPGKTSKVIVENEVVGYIGELHPKLANKYDVKSKLFLAELDLDSIFMLSSFVPNYSPIVRNSVVERELAIIVDKDVESFELIKIAKSIRNVIGADVVGIYSGDQVEDGKKSLSIKIYLQREETLVEEEIKEAVNNFLSQSNERLGARLRWHSNEI